jgi:GT2 family glycosyltransferase
MNSYKKKLPLVSVVLVNWNSEKDTLECVRSIKNSSFTNIKIIIVDNNSNNFDGLKLNNSNLDYILISLKENTGFTGGNNTGITKALDIGSEYIFILNNDTIIDHLCIEKLLEPFSNDNNIGVTTPIIYHYPNKDIIWSAGTDFNNFFLMPKNTGYLDKKNDQFLKEKFLKYANGCAFLIKSSHIKDAKSFTEDYFCMYEDVDLGLKLEKMKIKTYYTPHAIVWHKESISAGGLENPPYVYYQTRSALVFRKRWSKNFLQMIVVKLFFYIILAKRILRFLIKRNFRGILAIFLAIFDAYSSRLYKREYKCLLKK